MNSKGLYFIYGWLESFHLPTVLQCRKFTMCTQQCMQRLYAAITHVTVSHSKPLCILKYVVYIK